MIKVGICIATYKRVYGLKKLINGILNQKFIKNNNVQIILGISDNDIEASAKKVVDEFKNSKNNFIFIYGVEPKRGIAANRNNSIKLVGNVNFIVFIDDDEYPDEYWLDELIGAQKKYNADVVTAPVISEFQQGSPEWIKKENFFYRYRFKTGNKLKCAATGNTLVKYSAIKRFRGPFDESLGPMGGEDSILFTKIYNNNYNIIWCDTAIVKEFIPKSRCDVKWWLKREMCVGIGQTRIRLMLNSKINGIIKSIARGFGLIFKGFILLPLSLMYGKAKVIFTLGNILKGIGLIWGTMGITLEQYKAL
ncbi:glycosyltransferase family 2 protein [Clostridium sporogenes]